MRAVSSRIVFVFATLILTSLSTFATDRLLKWSVIVEAPEMVSEGGAGSDIGVSLRIDQGSLPAEHQSRAEQATVRNRLLVALDASSYFRVETFSVPAENLHYRLSYNIESSDSHKIFYLNAVDPITGTLVLAAQGTGVSAESAVKDAVQQLQRKSLTQPWSARVVAMNGNRVMIRKGRSDGLVPGLEMKGLGLQDADDRAALAQLKADEILLLYGEKAQAYKVVEVKESISLLEPVEAEASGLAVGDWVMVPGIDLVDPDAKSRNTEIWNNLYDNN